MLKRSIPVLFVACALVLYCSAGARAATPAPGWTISSYASPTNFSADDTAECPATETEELQEDRLCDSYELTVTNAGDAASNGSPVTIADTLPEGLTIRRIAFEKTVVGKLPEGDLAEFENAKEYCTGEGQHFSGSEHVVQCVYPHALAPDEHLIMTVETTVDEGATGALTNKAVVSGGGAPTISTEATNQVSSTPAPFGLSSFSFLTYGPAGTEESQAGGHPYELRTTIDLNSEIRVGGVGGTGRVVATVGEARDLIVDLPLGFVGSTLAAPECTEAQLVSVSGCPADTVVGELVTEPESVAAIDSPLWNMVPDRGYPAQFGYLDVLHSPHMLYAHVVPTPQGYVLQTTSTLIPEVNLRQITVTFYGDPTEKDDTGTEPQVPFFTNPASCANGPMVASIWADSWEKPGSFDAGGSPAEGDPNWVEATSQSPPVSGCNALGFSPELVSQPTTHEADAPTGLEFELKLAQPEAFGTDSTAPLKNAVITLPEGMSVDPSAADGLGVCSEAQIGFEGPTLFDFSPNPPQCPEDSKIGTLEVESPLIPHVLDGEIFLAAQNENPAHATFAAYVVIDDPVTGVLIKIAGGFSENPTTGQLTATFDENPQLPFTSLRLHFFGGPRAELATPQTCGTYTTASVLTPWSFPDSGPAAEPTDSYTINENCQVTFKPSFVAGSTNLQGGAYSTFQVSFSREDDENELSGVTVNLPPGMLANIASVPECSEAQIKETETSGEEKCPADTQVGTVTAGAGPGPNPLFVHGKVYFTGPYNGGPFGLVVVVPAKPGPFNFGLVVVRQSLRINPLTAAVTDVSDPFPTILDVTGANGHTDGIPIRLRRIDVEINRPGFTFNPTNCEKLAVEGTVTGKPSESSSFTVPFQVTNCAALAFEPTFKVSTAGKTSRKEGASLKVKLAYPQGALGKDANVRYVKVELPEALPSRLSTLQKACLAKVFDANPAGCPPESVVGHAVVHTQVLPVPLEGPAYFVSNGSAAFPNLVIVLQGDGVTIELVGETLIKKGVTSSTFAATPDTPFESFELTLGQGEYSALAANGDLCQKKLIMPTYLHGQNGATLEQSTRIEVQGCPNTISLVGHKQKGDALTLKVAVPAKGKLTASGKGLVKTSKTSTGRETITLELHEKKTGRRKAKVKLSFKPSAKKAKKLSKTVKVTVGKRAPHKKH